MERKKKQHPLYKEIAWIRKNWPFVEVCNNEPDGYLVITISEHEAGGQGRTFTQEDITECINYVKQKIS